MEIIEGKYCKAFNFAPDLSDRTRSDLLSICTSSAVQGRRIAIMPDGHPNGNGTITGFTMTSGDEVIVGLEDDSGCGVRYTKLNARRDEVDFSLLDKACHLIPAGKWGRYLEPAYDFDFSQLKCYQSLRSYYAWPAYLGSLGGGNHFIELDEDEDGSLYLLVHNGLGVYSGKAVDFYMQKALEKFGICRENAKLEDTILRGDDKEDFLFDMRVFEELCKKNRAYITSIILDQMGWKEVGGADVCHHFVSQRDGIIRHGAISAQKDDPVIIPINAREGCLLGVGKGNPDWNYSAPHGGGRLYSRKQARDTFSMEQYKAQMAHVRSSTIFEENLDEIPSAYRNLDDIMKLVSDTMEIRHVLRPLYNYKGK